MGFRATKQRLSTSLLTGTWQQLSPPLPTLEKSFHALMNQIWKRNSDSASPTGTTMSLLQTRELTARTWAKCERRKALIPLSKSRLIVSDGFSISKERRIVENNSVWTFACHVHLLAGVCGGWVRQSHRKRRNRFLRLFESAGHRQHAVCTRNQQKIIGSDWRIHRTPLHVKQNGFYCNWWLFNGRHGKTNWIQLNTFFIPMLCLQENWGLVSFKWKAFLFLRSEIFHQFKHLQEFAHYEPGRRTEQAQNSGNYEHHHSRGEVVYEFLRQKVNDSVIWQQNSIPSSFICSSAIKWRAIIGIMFGWTRASQAISSMWLPIRWIATAANWLFGKPAILSSLENIFTAPTKLAGFGLFCGESDAIGDAAGCATEYACNDTGCRDSRRDQQNLRLCGISESRLGHPHDWTHNEAGHFPKGAQHVHRRKVKYACGWRHRLTIDTFTGASRPPLMTIFMKSSIESGKRAARKTTQQSGKFSSPGPVFLASRFSTSNFIQTTRLHKWRKNFSYLPSTTLRPHHSSFQSTSLQQPAVPVVSTLPCREIF